MERVSSSKAHGGEQQVWTHQSGETGTQMTFAIYLPEAAPGELLPVLWYLSGLTCTHANVMDKGEYRAACAEHRVIFVAPDTSPRGEDVPDAEGYDLGQGAGFFIDATEEPWSKNYRMESYVATELTELIAAQFPVDMERQSLMGHSMGGHGALTLALRRPGRFKSVSAFAPIVAPAQVPWGQKAFRNYLGVDEQVWHQHDAYSLILVGRHLPHLLIDQGDADPFLETQLKPELLKGVCVEAGCDLTLRMQAGYDHSYNFISTFMAEHVAWHAERLWR